MLSISALTENLTQFYVRLLVFCLLENNLVLQMAREFASGDQFKDLSHGQIKQAISQTTQLITSIPDKARRGAPTSLSPQYPSHLEP